MKYELMFILNPKQTDKEREKTLGEINTLITENGFEVVDEDVWGLKKMAYKMKGNDTGYYVVLNMTGEPEGSTQLRKDLLIQNNLLRYMMVKVADDYVLMRYDQAQTTASGAKVSQHAAELTKKVTGAKKKTAAKKEEKAAPEDDKKLDEQLQAIIEDADIDV